MVIPGQLNWQEHLFKEREENVTADKEVPCSLHGYVCKSVCKNCTWVTHYEEINGKVKIKCRPPVIWEG
ncbi:hypothetical protein SAMN05192532_10580 [Alteribacillus iranensis]|uniref:Uncharacterized protein n=1 Tax=Alteribacillus iranensis TaxID=930128 RepID=A0A1I2E444_9BACI|nr:hypothetical protein SAMN05192532_10580 [Alteribacillus iranensis]